MAPFSPPERAAATFLAENITSTGTVGSSSGENRGARTAALAVWGATGTGQPPGSTGGATGATDAGVWMPSKREESTPLPGSGFGAPSGCAATVDAPGGVARPGRIGTIGGVGSSDSGTLAEATGGGGSGTFGRGAAAAGPPAPPRPRGRSPKPGGGPESGAAGAGIGRDGSAAAGAAAEVFFTHSRKRASSSGARPAKRMRASGPFAATSPHACCGVPSTCNERRTVSPGRKGTAVEAWTPAAVTTACGSFT